MLLIHKSSLIDMDEEEKEEKELPEEEKELPEEELPKEEEQLNPKTCSYAASTG